ncbi:MAG: hypothetical protein V1905_03805 [bacterium]
MANGAISPPVKIRKLLFLIRTDKIMVMIKDMKMKLPNLTVGISSPALRRERNPAEAENLFRVHPRAYAHGFPRRGIKITKQNGFSAITALIVLAVVLAVGVIVYFMAIR